jgi:hypothetical protein
MAGIPPIRGPLSRITVFSVYLQLWLTEWRAALTTCPGKPLNSAASQPLADQVELIERPVADRYRA